MDEDAVAARLAVMYAGKIVETGDVYEIYGNPAHPYTEGLMASIPRIDQKGEDLNPIKGAPPNLMRIPPGCPFHIPRLAQFARRRGVSPRAYRQTFRAGARSGSGATPVQRIST